MSFLNGDLDYPYRVLELGYDFDLQQLRTQYKKMVFRYHPDKRINVASTTEFKILTQCYKYLLDRLQKGLTHRTGDGRYDFDSILRKEQEKEREREKSGCHMSLKGVYENERHEYENVNSGDLDRGGHFNLHRFNKEYDMHKYGDPIASKGYQEFMDREDPEEYSRINDGNNGYDALLQDSSDRIEPQPLDGIDLSDCYELGGEYRNLGRTSLSSSSKGLHYMDLYLAHTTSQIVDQRCKDKLPHHRTLDELKSERKKPIQLTRAEERELEAMRERLKSQEEKQRLLALQRDKEIQKYHARRNNMLR